MINRHVLGGREASARLDAIERIDAATPARRQASVMALRTRNMTEPRRAQLVEEPDAGVGVAPAEDLGNCWRARPAGGVTLHEPVGRRHHRHRAVSDLPQSCRRVPGSMTGLNSSWSVNVSERNVQPRVCALGLRLAFRADRSERRERQPRPSGPHRRADGPDRNAQPGHLPRLGMRRLRPSVDHHVTARPARRAGSFPLRRRARGCSRNGPLRAPPWPRGRR